MSEEYIFQTSYESKSDLLNFIKTDSFFKKIKDMLDVKNFKFVPELDENLFSSKYVKWPQTISYDTDFCVIGYSLPGLNFTQTFDLNYDVLYCNTQVKSFEIADFEVLVKINFVEEDDKVKLKIMYDRPTDVYMPYFVFDIVLDRLNKTMEKIFN